MGSSCAGSPLHCRLVLPAPGVRLRSAEVGRRLFLWRGHQRGLLGWALDPASRGQESLALASRSNVLDMN